MIVIIAAIIIIIPLFLLIRFIFTPMPDPGPGKHWEFNGGSNTSWIVDDEPEDSDSTSSF
jgi:hypothetical protein